MTWNHTKPGIRDPTDESWAVHGSGSNQLSEESSRVQCPYWIAQSRTEIHCESQYPGECRHILRFKHSELKKQHLDGWCCGRYEACEWYQILSQLDDPDL